MYDDNFQGNFVTKYAYIYHKVYIHYPKHKTYTPCCKGPARSVQSKTQA